MGRLALQVPFATGWKKHKRRADSKCHLVVDLKTEQAPRNQSGLSTFRWNDLASTMIHQASDSTKPVGSSMKRSRILPATIACILATAIGIGLIGTEALGSNVQQQSVVTTTTSIVVVAVPGFPIESILLGILVGFLGLMAIRRRRRQG